LHHTFNLTFRLQWEGIEVWQLFYIIFVQFIES
jgi:hypothetical protein